MNKGFVRGIFTVLIGLWSVTLLSDTEGVFDQYREMLGDDNPAIFVIFDGEEIWYTPAGPRSVSLEQCDLGLGPGVVEGAYAQLPRYFPEASQSASASTTVSSNWFIAGIGTEPQTPCPPCLIFLAK